MPPFSRRMPPPGDENELRLRAAALAGRTVGELAAALGAKLPASNVRGKGFVGQLVEHALGADADAGELPDFVALGVELKTVPMTAGGRPKESTFVCGIDLREAQRATWADSRLCRRLQAVLWVPVQAANVAPLPERTFGAPVLWRPTDGERAALQADWEDLMGAIGAGRGGSLTAHEGAVLQVRPKAAHARVRTVGPSADGAGSILPIGFYLRAGFVGVLLTGRTSDVEPVAPVLEQRRTFSGKN